MDHRPISIELDTSVEPRDALRVGAKIQLGAAREKQPDRGETVARREAKGLVYMSFGLSGATNKHLGVTDTRVSAGQIWIQRQGSLELGNALVRTLGLSHDAAQNLVGPCI